ncbi:MAG TPA: hypothetical protein VHX67_05020 [Acidimicrobiales bacterium]|nr:hypothetical protein [Acidimicrobiales bacterium]
MPSARRRPAPPWGHATAARLAADDAPAAARAGPPEPSGYGWNAGTGTLGTTAPDYGLTGIVLSTRAMTSPGPPAHAVELWESADGGLAD